MLQIRATLVPEPLDDQWVKHIVALLPGSMQEEHLAYVHPADTARSALGKLLLAHALGSRALLENWSKTHYGRPFLPDQGPFNLSHSGRLVLLALRSADDQVALGIDVERIKKLDFELFGPYMNEAEWAAIQASREPEEQFFHFWTAKEAVMKGEGMGFHLPIEDIELRGQTALVRGRTWQLQALDVPAGYMAHLACPEKEGFSGAVEWVDAGVLSRSDAA